MNARGRGVRGDLLVLCLTELDAMLVVQVGHLAPRASAGSCRCWSIGVADLRGALLELDGIAAGVGRHVDQCLGDGDVAVVVDADLADHVDRVPVADRAVINAKRVIGSPRLLVVDHGHLSAERLVCPAGGTNRASTASATSRIAPRPPARSVTTTPGRWRTLGCASATTIGCPTSARHPAYHSRRCPRRPHGRDRAVGVRPIPGARSPCRRPLNRHSTSSFAARRATTGFFSDDRMSVDTPAERSRARPMPSPRCT